MVMNMKYLNSMGMLGALTLCMTVRADFVIDEIKAVVEGPVRTDILLNSDIRRRSFDGMEHTLDDMILEVVKDQRAEQLGVTIEKEDVERNLHAMAHGEDVSQDTLTAQSKSFGFDTLEEFYTALKQLYRANSAMEVEVRSLLQVSEQEARAYSEQHPANKDGIFYLQTAFVSFQESIKNNDLKRAIEEQNKKYVEYQLEWSMPFDVAYKELAQDKDFIRTMHVGQIKAIGTDRGFQVYKLKNNLKPEPMTFEERRKDILNTLREDKFKQVFKKYNEEILQEVTVTKF